MLLGDFSLTSQDPFKSVNLKRRALNTLTLVRNAIRGGNIPLPEKVRANLEWEMMDIQKGFELQPAGAPFEMKSILPAAWLQARWEAVYPQPNGMWYPYFEDIVGSGPVRVDYIHSSQVLPDSKRGIGSRGDGHTTWLVLGIEGRAEPRDLSLIQADPKYQQFVSTHRPQPDPLMESSLVRQGRAAVLSTTFAEEMAQMKRSMTPMGSANMRPLQVCQETTPLLLKEDEKWKVRFSASFQQTQQGTSIVLGQVLGLDMCSVVALMHIQRLALILLWLIYGNEVSNLDHQMLSYVDAEDRMKQRGLSDLDSSESVQKEEAWKNLQSALESRMTKRKAELVAVKEATQMKAWKTSKLSTLVAARSLSMAELPEINRCFRPLSEKQPGDLTVIVGEVDGVALRRMLGLSRATSKSVTIACLNAGLCVNSYPSPYGRLPSVEQVLKELKQPCPKGRSEDPVFGLAPGMSLVDPALSFCWLALRHYQWLKRKVEGP